MYPRPLGVHLVLLVLLLSVSGCATTGGTNGLLVGLSGGGDDPLKSDQPPLPAHVPAATIMMVPAGAPTVTAQFPLHEVTYVQNALEKTGLNDRFRRMSVELYRPMESGNHRLEIQYDRVKGQVVPSFDYALRPGDRLVVSEDTSTVLDDMLESIALPFGPSVKR